MCGILGRASKDLANKQHQFKKMLEYINFRGKDNTGYYFGKSILLGHKRLSIIDLEKGNQPMIHQNYIIIYNGELYNTNEIKKTLIDKGYTFNTTSDTEVLLKGYVEYKEKILNQIEGIFAFAIYNTKNKEIFLARDHFGVKPLYYTKKKSNFIFSSMIKSVLASKIIEPILTKKELGEILALGPSKKTGSGIFKDIKELRPAHYLIYKKGKTKVKRYWNVETKKCLDTFETAKKNVESLLTNSIKRQMISDVGIATLLSGGLDSSIITAITANELKKENKTLTTFSIDYENNNKYFKANDFQVSEDKYYIDLMSKNFNTKHKYQIIKQKDVAKFLKEALYAKDYPGMADIDSSLLWFSKQIAKSHKVILSGECADEIFGGYPWFYRNTQNNNKNFPWIKNLKERQQLLNNNLQNKINLKKICKKEYTKTIRELPKKERKDKYKKLFYINMTHFMTTLLDRKDRMTMKATIEAQVPFANTKLIEYLWNIPFNYKYQNNTEKNLLREAYKDLLPKEIIQRKKNPYPKTHNPKYLTIVTNLLKERISKPNSQLLKIFDINKINSLLTSNDYQIPWFGQLMTTPQLIAYLYQFDLWLDEYNIILKI